MAMASLFTIAETTVMSIDRWINKRDTSNNGTFISLEKKKLWNVLPAPPLVRLKYNLLSPRH